MGFPHRTWNFNIDRYLNPFVPPPPWKYLPYPVAWFLGHRKTKPRETGNLMPIFWASIGIFAAILLIQGVSKQVPSFAAHGAPLIVGSFGAAAVLEFYTIEAPLAQPRNALVGQFISALVGVTVAKLFQLSDRFPDTQWVGGALACALATALMALTKTVHPPAGATALLAVVDTTLVRIGWFLLPVVMLGCALMLAVALLVNNIERRFPIYWWTPEECGRRSGGGSGGDGDGDGDGAGDSSKGRPPPILKRRPSDELQKTASMLDDEEKQMGGSDEHSTAGAGTGADDDDDDDGRHEQSSSFHEHGSQVKTTARSRRIMNFRKAHLHLGEIVIRRGEVVVPQHMFLTQEEEQLLETMSYRL
ncbi:hypothetical protein E4U55_001502 [Claviceps digitariae]|nr:hypothetical protein E4U55_001502 [Claviceps digitariae]